jgi:hypothetical protein
MDKTARDFFCCLLRAHSPSGDESAHQRIWLDYVKTFAQATPLERSTRRRRSKFFWQGIAMKLPCW